MDEETKKNFIDMGRKEAVDNVQSMYGVGKLSSRKSMKKTFRVPMSTSTSMSTSTLTSISNEQPKCEPKRATRM